MRLCALFALAIGIAIPFTAGATFAHHSFAGEFDNTIAVRLHGVVTSIEMVNPHSFIYIDVESDGAIEKWALEGPGPRLVQRRYGALDVIKVGDELGVCGYLARRDVVPTRTEPVTGKTARKLQAAVLTTAHRGTFVWNNYGQRKCGLDT